MTLLNRFKALFSGKQNEELLASFAQSPYFEQSLVEQGRLMQLPKEELEQLAAGVDLGLKSMQFSVLALLAEEGLAEEIDTGFLLPTKTLGLLVDAERASEDPENEISLYKGLSQILRLPKPYEGQFVINTRSNSANHNFNIDILATIQGSEYPFKYEAGSGEIRLSLNDRYALGQADITALEAWMAHKKLRTEERTEEENLRLLTKLHESKKAGMCIELGHFKNFSFRMPDRVGVTVTQDKKGGLTLTPDLGENTHVDDIDNRLHQLKGSKESGVLRIDNTVVLLEGDAFKGAENIIENNRIPAHQADIFLKTPSAFLDASVVDLDSGFSARVEGIGELKHLDFGFVDTEKNDWFNVGDVVFPFKNIEKNIHNEKALDGLIEKVEEARRLGHSKIHYNGLDYTIEDTAAIAETISALREKYRSDQLEAEPVNDTPYFEDIEEEDKKVYGINVKDVAEENQALLDRAKKALQKNLNIEWSAYARQPFPHQKEGVEWIVGLLQQALSEDGARLDRLRGALLADDMGLGKTYMSLIAMAEYYRLQKIQNEPEKPILVVAPLSLLENWADEVAVTFKESIFDDVVILQSNRDLNSFRIAGLERESEQLKALTAEDLENVEDKIRYALKIGDKHGRARLDQNRRLVLTTYDTLRNYQISLCSVDWGLVMFDEAQHIKNANSLQTRAAKTLKSDFNLLVTGTPIENNLAEFWCLMDTAQPGLLGDYAYFKDRWILPLSGEEDQDLSEVRDAVGQDLREATGDFMLRRTKEDELQNLPTKTIFSGAKESIGGIEYLAKLAYQMQGAQLSAYDDILKKYHEEITVELEGPSQGRGQALSALAKLRNVSLHPCLYHKVEPFGLLEESRGKERHYLSESGKLVMLLNVLDEIAERDEKVIIFCITKNLQLLLKHWLGAISGLNIAIINGDTKAVSSGRGGETRKTLIRDFEQKEGFNMIIMSPVAAGTGLTVVGANHVIHLERHWNPAKEAQATDRVYRIGQKKPVSIYLPLLKHPSKSSFDEHLDRLLQRKMLIKDSVMVPESVSEKEFMQDFF